MKQQVSPGVVAVVVVVVLGLIGFFVYSSSRTPSAASIKPLPPGTLTPDQQVRMHAMQSMQRRQMGQGGIPGGK